ncbi:FAD/NAD(P)-binding oxidoreductase [Thiothrix subterranea]|uniref:FAD/NAD(P)-binding oxidoreductase n=2 Tax=Thiothrix subterranea TaxID=2735563 RepID=A0AA51QZM8_9GAMM|nr:FAD/NAD(P)-binding oxidoreductase [Thiothrix subterranea]MDQ5769808.1 FAD/NAD(P)-binding oxidoreductase [Thiothrix subterranea]WML87172.1 FAD/NAD(P)-binding oxidoreductase [Thiothrix subterranea]
MQRRDFLRLLGTGAALGMMAPFADVLAAGSVTMPGNTGANGRVVVIGGGMAGTTVAKYLRLWGGTGVQVTLVEPNPTYISNIFSNKVLTGERTLTQLSYKYGALTSRYGVKLITKSVTAIDYVTQQVTLNDNSKLPYDRLVIAPGVAFDALPMSGTAAAQAKVVHAWQAGVQTTSLQTQIKAMTKADTFILTVPAKPYRCPPGPYERACVVADYLKRVKKGGKVVVLDANPGIQAEVENFTYAFKNIHKNITYVPNASISSIDANTGTVNTSVGAFKGKVVNAIPPHRAGKIITDIPALANVGGRWAGVNVLSYESAIPNIHVIGDAAATTQPKAGHIANAEAKVCADAIVHLLRGEAVNPSPMTNSACYTPITNKTASWLSVVYRYDPVTGTMLPTGNGVTESSGINKDNHDEMLKWFSNLMADTFA